MFSMVAVVFLIFAFAILVGTFMWIAHLLAERAEKQRKKKKRRPKPAAAEPAADVPEPEEEPPEMVRGRGYGANYGLLLGVLSCGLFWLSPLVMALSFVGGFYSGRSLVNGVRHFRVVVWRGVAGLLLCVGGVVLQFGLAVGLVPPPAF